MTANDGSPAIIEDPPSRRFGFENHLVNSAPQRCWDVGLSRRFFIGRLLLRHRQAPRSAGFQVAAHCHLNPDRLMDLGNLTPDQTQSQIGLRETNSDGVLLRGAGSTAKDIRNLKAIISKNPTLIQC